MIRIRPEHIKDAKYDIDDTVYLYPYSINSEDAYILFASILDINIIDNDIKYHIKFCNLDKLDYRTFNILSDFAKKQNKKLKNGMSTRPGVYFSEDVLHEFKVIKLPVYRNTHIQNKINDIKKRDMDIKLAHDKGMTYTELSKKYNLSINRISNIVHNVEMKENRFGNNIHII